MGFWRTLFRASALCLEENALDLVSVALPGLGRAAAQALGTQSRWLTTNLWAAKTVDGGILGGVTPPQAGAKYTVPKGLPRAGEKALAIENEPHTADGFNGEITAGYGKGTKTLLFDERVPVKIGTKMMLTRANLHYHDADVAGPHYDLVFERVPPGTKQFEFHVPRGDYRGRYALVTTKKGQLIVPMTDQGVQLAKPAYVLKGEDFLEQVAEENVEVLRTWANAWGRTPPQEIPGLWTVGQKYDGALANGLITPGRAVFRSHRDGGSTYYDRIPQVEDLYNHSRFWLWRRWLPAPNLAGTLVQGELVHPDGHGRMGGILNALPDKAQEIQALRGPAEFYAWDIVKYKGRDVSGLPYAKRRALLELVVKDVRTVNPHWHVAREVRLGDDPRRFYRSVVSQPLPWGEGVVIRRAAARAGDPWFKIKQTDPVDFPIVGFVEGTGKYRHSLGALVVESPTTGARGEVGSFAISDQQRNWIWQHRDELAGAVAKVRVAEVTASGRPRAGVFVGFHEAKGSEASLRMYAETISGGDPAEAERAMYRLKSAAGWRRA